MEIEIIVADDHKLFRVGLIQMLESFAGVKVVAEAADGESLLRLLGDVGADLLTLDLAMPGVSGVSLIEAVIAAKPELPILILSMHDEPALVKQALRAGAVGYISKDADPEILFAAVSKVSQGGRYVAPAIAETLAFDFDDATEPEVFRQLSARETEVLKLITGDGLSLVEIAERLGLSPKTITTHKTNIMAKLGVTNNTELIRYAIAHQLIR